MHRKESKKNKTYLLASGLYLCTILPVILWRIQKDGSDLISGRVVVEANNVIIQYSHEQGGDGLITYAIHAIENFIQLGGWSLIPIFILFIPVGIYFLIKKNLELMHIFILIIILLIPVFFAFSIVNDVRYIFYVFPLFCLVSVLVIKKINEKIRIQNIFLILCGILISSIFFVMVQISLIIILGWMFGIIGVASSLVISSTTQMSYMILVDRYQKIN